MADDRSDIDDPPADDQLDVGDPPVDRRRRLLIYGALAALGAGGLGAWNRSRPTTADPATPSETIPDELPELVARYAPDLYFGALEKWYPTDPRQYVTETADGRVVDGFQALEDYSAAFTDPENPPDPTVFYRVVEAAESVDAIQYWFYSVFDQFTVNFHWHDWELLQVFVDRETDAPLLVSASAHARGTPNNEFVDPDLSAGRRLSILAEVGSHSSASELNTVLPTFERLPTADRGSDITNQLLDSTSAIATPFAYGLPRDEGARLPFVMPELDGERLDSYPGLAVDREDFIADRVTVDSWYGLPRPPADLPLREPGLVIGPEGETAATTYRLVPMGRVREAIDDFVGPQLSFEFAVPGFLEDQFASHITSVGIPWDQPRYADPLADVTDPAHRHRIDGNRPHGLLNRVAGRVRLLSSGAEGALDGVSDAARDVLADLATVSQHALPTEVAVRLASENPEATVTRDGLFGYLHVEPGEHLLTINGPGCAPFAQRFVHEGGLKRVGSDGELTLVANEDVGWIRGDGRAAAGGIAHVRVIEDYAGVVYEGQPVEDDWFAVAVHRAGQYTVEILDGDGRPGAYRVGPEAFETGEATREIATGKQSLVTALAEEIGDLRAVARSLAGQNRADNELTARLSEAREEATAAGSAAEGGEAQTANRRLSTVVSLLEAALEFLLGDRQDAYSDAAVAVLEPRIRTLLDRAESATQTEL